jgi:octaprenyl-diphosphate synthase
MDPELVRTQDAPLVQDEGALDAELQEQFLSLVGEKLAATEIIFRQFLESDVPFIRQANDYIASSGGKRIRPALLLLTSRLLGQDGEEEITYAAVIEFIHTASLVHDDIIDHALLRRGNASVNELWGNSRTVLLGDWIYTTAMKMALRHDSLQVVRKLCSATLKMTEGELLTLERLGARDVGVDEYFSIIDRKTACLFAAAASIPALIPPAKPDAEAALHRYGAALGRCFQLVDDLLDFTATQDELGKPVLSDLKEGKLTLPLILLLPRIDIARRRKIDRVLEDRSFDRVSPSEILEIVHGEGTLDEVSEMASAHAEEACRELSFFPASPARAALEYAPSFILKRRS